MLFIEWDALEKALRVLRLAIVEPFRILYQIDNLFVADGSLHVSNGGFNPSLTIMALGYWVGGYNAREWKGTRFRQGGHFWPGLARIIHEL